VETRQGEAQARSLADAVARRSYGKLVDFLAAPTRDVAILRNCNRPWAWCLRAPFSATTPVSVGALTLAEQSWSKQACIPRNPEHFSAAARKSAFRS